MNVLVIDIGGTNIKFLAMGQSETRRFPSGWMMTLAEMVARLRQLLPLFPELSLGPNHMRQPLRIFYQSGVKPMCLVPWDVSSVDDELMA
jgi:hypothetical protein